MMNGIACIASRGAQTLLIGSQWRSAAETMPVRNPYTGEVLATVACATATDVEDALRAAKRAQAAYRAWPTHRRASLLRDVASLVAQRREEFARGIVAECGKPVRAALKEVDRCINTLVLSAEEATRICGETINFDSYSGGEDRRGYFQYEPVGIVVAITPFNDPLNLVAHKLGPALAAGNVVILKPAEQAPLTALRLVEVFIECGLPAGALGVLTGRGVDFGNALVSAPEVALVSFTGGEVAGDRIARAAGAKKLLMELGGNCPVIVTAHCDQSQAVASCVAGAFGASGQNCIGVQRIYLHRDCYESFAREFVEQVAGLSVGSPELVTTDVGPMISDAALDRVEHWVERAVNEGASIRYGGARLGNGCYAPTVMSAGDQPMQVTDEEVFGPVVSLHSFGDLKQAIDLANRPEYMIHAAIFTDDLREAMYAVDALDCAGVLINDSTDYRLDAMPFGGARRGALGREGVKYAIAEMTQTKTVCMNLQYRAS